MVQSTMTQRLTEQGLATIRALSSLTRRDADAVRAAVRVAGSAFSVQEHDDYDGYLSLLLTPTQAVVGVDWASLLISGRTGAVDVAEIDGDDMRALGTYASVGAAMLVLRPALESGGRVERASQRSESQKRAERLVREHGADAGIHAAMRADAEGNGRHWKSTLRVIDHLDSKLDSGKPN